jgi:hypothetical protein
MSDGEDWRNVASALQEQVDRLDAALREERTLRCQRDQEVIALLAHVLSDQHIHRGRLDAEEDTHAALSDSERGRARLLSEALRQAADGAQVPERRLRRVV